jgi:cell division protein FtsB
MLTQWQHPRAGYLLGLLLAAFILVWLILLWWLGDSGIRDQASLQQLYDTQLQALEVQEQLNHKLSQEVAIYKDVDSRLLFEQRARMDLGLIRPGETFVQLQRGSSPTNNSSIYE